MKSILYFLIITFIFITGCEKDFIGTVNPVTESPVVLALTAIGSFQITPEDTAVVLHINLSQFSSVSDVRVEMFNPQNNRISPFPLGLYDNGSGTNGDQAAGDGIYSNIVNFSSSNINGNYRIDYYISLTNGEEKKAGSESFLFNNGTSNIVPVINRVIAPDTLTVTGVIPFLLAAEVVDSNGAGDIERVYFQTFRPDGSTNGFQFDMNDAGAEGDITAGDGTWSLAIKVDSTNQKGTYRFEFKARDRGKLTSLPSNYYITIK